eukprot:PITA_12121
MDSLRKQLDALMGTNGNGDVTEIKRNYYYRDVCRLYLAGLCPHNLFQLTKMDLGACSKVHSLQLRKEYEVTQSPEVEDYTKQIKEKLKETEYLDLEGRSDDKIRIMELVEELIGKRADKQAMLLLEDFNKDRASMPQPLQTPPRLAPLPMPGPTDAHTQEMIIERLKKVEEHLPQMGTIHSQTLEVLLTDLREEKNKLRNLIELQMLKDRTIEHPARTEKEKLKRKEREIVTADAEKETVIIEAKKETVIAEVEK